MRTLLRCIVSLGICSLVANAEWNSWYSAEVALVEFGKNFVSNSILQKQVEVDLDNGLLWVFSLKMDSKQNFIITTGKLNKDAIITLQRNEAIPPEDIVSGHAKIGDAWYTLNLVTKKWEPGSKKEVMSQFARYNYFQAKTCFDLQYEIASLNEQLKELDAAGKTNEALKTKVLIAQLSDISPGKRSFKRNKWDIVYHLEADDFIGSWEVYESGILFRKITNQLVPLEVLSKSSLPEFPQKFPGYSMEDAFKKLGKTPLLGIFFAQRPDGSYYTPFILKGSPADLAKVEIGDEILKVNGVEITKMPLKDVLKLVAEKETVLLTLRRKNGNPFDMPLKKAVVNH